MSYLKIGYEHSSVLDEWFSRPVVEQRFYQVVYYAPNPFVQWEIPIGVILVDTGKPRCISVVEWTLPSNLGDRQKSLVGTILDSLLKVSSKATLLETLPCLGPHFRLGSAVNIPSNTPDELWVVRLFKGDE